MLYGVVLREYPKQVVSLVKAGGVPANMREFLFLLNKKTLPHRRHDFHFTAQNKRAELFRVQMDAGLSHKGSKEHFVRSTCMILGTVC